jgi:cytochrome c-type biogenesis protein CcmH
MGARARRSAGLRRAAAGACLVLAACGTWAVEAPEIGPDPAAERRMMALAAELRCLQCQNQTLADSEAPLALDLRQQMRELIAQGRSDEQIKEYLTARYGDFVLYRPPVKAKTLVLWFGPGVILVAGLLGLLAALRRRNARLAAAAAAAGDTPGLSAAEAQRARELLDTDDPERSLS